MNVVLASPFGDRLNQYLGNVYDRFFRTRDMVHAGQTPFSVVHDNGLIKLRHYHPLPGDSIPFLDGEMPVSRERFPVPLVIVPPLAVNTYIYDLFPERSLVRYFLARGFDVYMIDWGSPDRRYTHYDMHDYVAEFMPDFLGRVRTHSGQQELSIHAWSMSGMFSLAYGGLGDDPHIRNLVVLGTPVDSHASGSLGRMYQRLGKATQAIEKLTGFAVGDIRPGFLHSPGWANVIGFKFTNPVGSVQGYWELLRKFGDREFVESHATTSAFLDNMVDYPGAVLRDTTWRVWMRNEFSKGGIRVGERQSLLKNIRSNLLAIAGKGDTMVTPDSARAVLEKVGSTDKEFAVVPGGHMGIVAGSQAPQITWKLTADWLAARSGKVAASKSEADAGEAVKKKATAKKKPAEKTGATKAGKAS